MERNQAILVQIKTAEELLESSGVRAFCLECIHGPEGGCCQGCDLLGESGCTNKPLACALWLCSNAKFKFQDATTELRKMAAKWPWEVSHSPRMLSLRAELLQLAGEEPCA